MYFPFNPLPPHSHFLAKGGSFRYYPTHFRFWKKYLRISSWSFNTLYSILFFYLVGIPNAFIFTHSISMSFFGIFTSTHAHSTHTQNLLNEHCCRCHLPKPSTSYSLLTSHAVFFLFSNYIACQFRSLVLFQSTIVYKQN